MGMRFRKSVKICKGVKVNFPSLEQVCLLEEEDTL